MKKLIHTPTLLHNPPQRIKLDRFAGQWVAFVDGKIMANASSLPQLMKSVERKKIRKKPAVLLVPRKDEGPYILLSKSVTR